MTQTMGIRHLRDGIEPQSIVGADMAVIGLVGTAEFANATVFPMDKETLVYTNDTTMLAALGSTGTLPDAIAGISAQLGNSAAKIVLVRVATDALPANVITNIIGSEASSTGMWAFLNAPESLGVTPRILLAPGYTSQTENGVSSIAVGTQGTGYTADFPVTATGGSGSGFAGTAVVADGKVQSITIDNPGKGYTAAPTLVLTAGSGTGAAATATVAAVANQICVSIPTICDRLKAKFIPEGPSSSRAAALTWLQSLPRSSAILHPLRQDAKVTINGSTVTKPLSPYVAGLYVRRDAEMGGVPSRSVANQSMNGLVGVTPKIGLDITNDSSIGMADIFAHFGIVVRGDIGSDGSLSDGGMTFWGTDTLSANTEWQFANVVRLRDYVEIDQVKALRNYLGRENITVQTVQAVYNTLDSALSSLRAGGHIIDYKIEFRPSSNSPENIRLGFLDITFRMEEPAPLRMLTIHSLRYRDALTAMVQNIAVQLGTLTSS